MSRNEVILDYLVDQWIIHLLLIALDLFIAITLYKDYQQIDWLILPCIFVALPHLMQSFATLGRQKWPTLDFQLSRGFTVKENLTRIWENLRDYSLACFKFDWCQILQALPGLHFFKRLMNCMTLIKRPEKQPEIQAVMEEENLYCSIWHSGPQIIMQLTLVFQLNQFSIHQILCVVFHSLFMIQNASGFFFSQKAQPEYQSKISLNRLLIALIILPIFAIRLISLAFLFSYAKTYVTVAFIVVFGIAYFALFYEIYLETCSKMLQLMQLLLSIWIPVIPGLAKHFALKTILPSFALHVLSHLVLMVHMCTQQYPTIKDLPQLFHCFPVESKFTYCPVENRFDIQVDQCQNDIPTDPTTQYIRNCADDEYPYSTYIVIEIVLILCLFVSLLLNLFLYKLMKKENFEKVMKK